MKKIFIFLGIFTLLVGAFGCKQKAASQEESLKVVASFYPVYIIARNISTGVQGVNVINMTPPITGCLHDYSLTTDDMKNLESARLFIINGGGMESFMPKITRKYSDLKVAELTRGIDFLKDGDNINPHVWVSVVNAKVMTRNCAAAFCEIDPVHSVEYNKNRDAYISKLENLEIKMKHSLAQYKGKKIITFHEAFPYFAQDFGLIISTVIEREPGSEPSPKEITETIEIVKNSNIKALFAEPQYPSTAAQVIARETGAKIYILDPAVTGSDDLDSYINIMNANLAVLQEALR